jgi:hypothetical protein
VLAGDDPRTLFSGVPTTRELAVPNRRSIVAIVTLAVVTARQLGAQQASPRCGDVPAYSRLDFWVGKWDVLDPSGTRVGSSVIEKILRGCAILENWRDMEGREGKSLFYYDRPGDAWKQVWVTDDGHFKEKSSGAAEQKGVPEGSVRFQGRLPTRDGSVVLDRTTLTPSAAGRVRQLIEISRDDGTTWKAVFDGTYVRKSGASPSDP